MKQRINSGKRLSSSHMNSGGQDMLLSSLLVKLSDSPRYFGLLGASAERWARASPFQPMNE